NEKSYLSLAWPRFSQTLIANEDFSSWRLSLNMSIT
ncbi:MAG: hypothetical protein ACJAXS_002483, partial [Colwellia sp.]